MPKFTDKVFGANVAADIQTIFKNLQKGSFETQVLESVENYNGSYLGDRPTFARAWTPLLISGSDTSKIIYHTLNDNRTLDYQAGDSISDDLVNELRDNDDLLNSKAGITSIDVTSQGTLGAIKETTIQFVVHNRTDFETIYQPYFLKPGATIVVDYGWSGASVELYSISEKVENTDLELKKLKRDLYGKQNADGTNLTGFVNGVMQRGVLDVSIGQVIDYSSKLTPNGSYECSVTLLSPNASLVDSEITEENNLKFLLSTRFEEILIRLLTSEDPDNEIKVNQLFEYDQLSKKDKERVVENFYENQRVLSKEEGVLPKHAVRNGIFYQSITPKSGPISLKNTSYISYGLFEDLFLNTLVAENSQESEYDIVFNTKDTMIRYDDNLINRQKATLDVNEKLTLFLYPGKEAINKSYNARNGFGNLNTETIIEQYQEMLSGTYQGYNTKVIPLRDLFISMDLIIDTFAKKQNINDALENIYESLNKDSYGIFKLKMSALDKSYSSLSCQDVNLIPELPAVEELLEFDVISGNGIVSGLDFGFSMPKGNLANQIAIGGSGDFKFYDDDNKDNLSFATLLGPDKKLFGDPDTISFLDLPISKTKPTSEEKEKLTVRNVRYERASKVIQNNLRTGNDTKTKYSQNWTDIIKKIKAEQDTDNKNAKSSPKSKDANKNTSRNEVSALFNPYPAHSIRDYYGKLAKINVVLSDNAASISPILPPELNLTVYGNTYLNYGDIISINYLPKHVNDMFVFMIIKVSHKVDTNWQTTYTTKPFLRPKFKSNSVKPNNMPLLSNDYFKDLLSSTDDRNDTFTDTIKGGVDVETDAKDVNVFKTDNFYNSGYLDTEDAKRKFNPKTKDGRKITNLLAKPKTLQEMMMLVAINRFLMKYMKFSTNDGNDGNIKNTLIAYSKEEYSDPPYEDTPNAGMYIRSYVEDSSIAGIGSDALFTYFEDSPIYDAGVGDFSVYDRWNKIKKFLGIVKEYTEIKNWNNTTFRNPGSTSRPYRPPSENVSGGGKIEGVILPVNDSSGGSLQGGKPPIQINTDYGQIFPSFGFQATEKVSEEQYNNFLVVCNFANLSSTHNKFIVPEWFLTNVGISAAQMAEELEEFYYDEKLLEFFKVTRQEMETTKKSDG
jgi:hypothetical protein